ncbi:helix-turn-helix domain-containing protein [Paraburkholderia sp. HD33-4]|uniref:helix-turn-helix domain-containing protein n=1 Tax=Paraburkholderia sp. HD33-4 TaxID=2883242 RepID=UPI001F1F7869|nr:helix-turn-helix transcriptional regulator [Paraburkholderia sp. HD33-4]
MGDQTPSEMLAEIKGFTGMTETALASRLEISQPTVNRMLKGQVKCSSTTLLAIFRLHADMKAGKLKPVESAAAA